MGVGVRGVSQEEGSWIIPRPLDLLQVMEWWAPGAETRLEDEEKVSIFNIKNLWNLRGL